MGNRIEVIVDGVAVQAELEGGPPDITQSVQRAIVDEAKIKLLNGNGYEHFERVDGPHSRVFRWIMRTEIAE